MPPRPTGTNRRGCGRVAGGMGWSPAATGWASPCRGSCHAGSRGAFRHGRRGALSATAGSRLKVLLNFHLGEDVLISVPGHVLAALRARFPDVLFVAADDAERLAREAGDADVFYGFRFPEELLPRAPRLRWIQSISAGIEGNLSAPVLGR